MRLGPFFFCLFVFSSKIWFSAYASTIYAQRRFPVSCSVPIYFLPFCVVLIPSLINTVQISAASRPAAGHLARPVTSMRCSPCPWIITLQTDTHRPFQRLNIDPTKNRRKGGKNKRGDRWIEMEQHVKETCREEKEAKRRRPFVFALSGWRAFWTIPQWSLSVIMSTISTAVTSESLRKAALRVKLAHPLIAAARIVCFSWKGERRCLGTAG